MNEGVRQLLNSFITLRCYLLSLKIMIWFQLALWHPFTFSPYTADFELQRFSHCSACVPVLHPQSAFDLSPGLPWCLRDKESTSQWRRHEFNPWVGKIPWRRKCQPSLVFLPREFHGQRILAGHSPWGRRVRLSDLVTKQQQKQQPIHI